ncbi:hypothetical protein ACHAPU_011373 [Fusarium lateritium]
MRGFEIHFASGSRRWTQSIGYKRIVMKYLTLEPGKEFITSCYVTRSIKFECRVIGLRFVTNWGNQLMVGDPGEGEEKYPPETNPSSKDSLDVGLAGLNCEWLNDGGILDQFDTLYRAIPKVEHEDEVCGQGAPTTFNLDVLDETGETEVVFYGRRETQNEMDLDGHEPGFRRSVDWLDCTGRLDSIKATFLPWYNIPADTASIYGLQLHRQSLGVIRWANRDLGSRRTLRVLVR